MKRIEKRSIIGIGLLLAVLVLAATTLAQAQTIFPGAVGFGVDSPAGRGGRIIKVTNLNNSGLGSFREALAYPGRRIIVFEVGGIIDLQKEELRLAEPYVTIAGQTAPSPGITFIRGGMVISTHDVLMQHLRFRMGDAGETAGSGFEPDVSIYGSSAYNVVIDHCSFAWGVDENLSVSGPRLNGPDGTARRVTLSHNIIAEGLMNSIHSKGAHSMGSLIHDYCTEIAVIGNFFAHNNERNPWYKGFATGVIVNNLIYNPGVWAIRLGYVAKEWTGSGINPEPPRVSIVGNHLIQGANTPSGRSMVGSNSEGQAYLEDNLIVDGLGNPGLLISGITVLESRPIWIEELHPLAAADTPEYVLQRAGARPRDRDSVDQRLIVEFLNRQGSFVNSQEEVGGYPSADPVYRALDIPDGDIDLWLDSFARAVQ